MGISGLAFVLVRRKSRFLAGSLAELGMNRGSADLLMSKEKKARAVAAGAGSSGKSGGADKFAVKRRYPRFTLDARLQVRMFQDGEYRTCWGRH
jgi:hypothetical protein